MNEGVVDELARRVLLQAPTARDAAVSRDLLATAGIGFVVCATLAELCHEAQRGVGAALITAEAILADRENRLAELLRSQPQWSDLPVIVLTPPGPDSARLLQSLDAVGHMTLMKRPVQVASLVSAIRSSLRDRERQYAVRDLLVEREQSAEKLRIERELYRVTLSSIGDAVIATDIAGRVTFLNAVAEELTGWPASEACGRSLTDVFHILHETTRQEVESPALRALEQGRIVGLANHTVLIGRDGTERSIDDSAAPIIDANGNLNGAVLVFRDISERKQAEEARARLAAIVESSDDAIIGKTLDGVIQFWNAGAERVFGYTSAEVQGKSITLIIPPDRLDEEREILSRLRRGIRIDHFETVRVAKDGRRLDISLTVSPIRDAEGVVIGASKVARDITDRKRADAELARLGETLALALGAAELGTWDWDVATDLLTLSKRGAEIYGLPPGRQYPREWMRNLLRPDYQDLAREAAARSVRERTEYDIEYPLENGSWVAARGRGIYDENGALIRMLGVVQDVTARKRADSELRQSEERHRVLVNATSDVVYRMSADWSEMQPLDGRALIASNAGPIRDWMKKNLPPTEHAAIKNAIERAIASRSMFELEHQVFRPDGTIGWTFSRAAPILDANGNIVEWFGTARDITDQKRAAEELARLTAESERQRRLYETVLSATPDFVYVFSLDYRVLYANEALIQMWGRGREGAIGKTFLEIGYEPWHAERHAREIDQVRDTKKPIRGEVPFTGTQGRRIYDYIFVPVVGTDGVVEAVAGTTRDVTDRKELENALRDTDRKKDDFIALLAHELRNPLAPIRNGLQVIRLAGGEGPMASVREMMDRQLAHMVRLIDDLLDVSRIGRNKMELRRARISIAEVVANAVETARPALEEASQELIVALPPQAVFMDADLTRLAQVFSNLLTNSAKYTEPGGKIWLTADRRDGVVVVSVRDTGIGIPAESLPTLFDMFSQVDRSVGRSAGGLGIGLALVKGLVEMHGGAVTAHSDGPGRGSEFIVTLPSVDEPLSIASPAVEIHRPIGGPRRRVLVVDDNRDGAGSMALMLKLIGNEVVIAHDGLEAIAQAEHFQPELILMDVGMPRLDGLEATRRIRSQPWGRRMKIVALTGWGQEADRERSRAAECDGHLVKPVSLPDLQKLLTEMGGEK